MNDHRRTMMDQDHLREMIEVISGELELRPLLTMIVQKACELLHADRGSIGLIDSKEDLVKIEAVYKMPPAELGSTARPGESLAGKVYESRAPVLIERYGDLDSAQLEGMDEDSVVGMPILWRGDIIGTFGIGAGPPKRFGDNDLRMLEVFARHAAIAIHNARSYEREKNYAALKERQRLARDLHDNVSQLIFSLSLVAQSVGAGYEKSKAEGDARAARLCDIAGLAQREMKTLLAELTSPADDEASMAAYARRNGLKKALEKHCALAAPDEIAVAINVPDDIRLTGEMAETLLRIAQEALANAFRHAQAENISIMLETSACELRFIIKDDGDGLRAHDNGAGGASTHIGLKSMRARAARAGGVLTVTNVSDGGVCIKAAFPHPDNANRKEQDDRLSTD